MTTVDLEPIARLQRDVRSLAADMGLAQARGLVDLYYQMQEFRIHAGNQNHALEKSEEPHAITSFFAEQFFNLERDVQKALDTFSASSPLGEWARLNVGVGPVLAAGLLAHIDVRQAHNPSSLWRFAGLSPGQEYVKGQRRDWNARLKALCWKLGDSFVKQSFRDECYYGKLYLRRKEKELARNEAVVERAWVGERPENAAVINGRFFQGGNCRAAQQQLTSKTIRDKDLRAILESGKLPAGQLLMRSRRYAIKRFLVHYFQAAWIIEYGEQPARAYVFDELGHVDEEPPPVPFPSAMKGK